jgi:DNA-binding NtrC family response regulator
MPLSSLIISRDSQEISVFECILSSLRIDVEVETDPSVAWTRLNKSKVDAVIVDCDLGGADRFLRNLRAGTDQDSKPVVVISGSGEHSRLQAAGGEFVAQKPISVEQAVHTFSAARNLILKARLRYYRQSLDTPISITDTKEQINASLLNLSQSGIRVRLKHPHALRGDVGVHFLLPGTQLALDARGEVAWTDARGNAGIRLVNLTEPAKRDLRLWLERQYFQTCGG